MQWTARIPATVITGYLGAGKTTLLNRILTAEHGRRVAAIVNEFGEIGIDNQLVIAADEEIFEMNNGCICCTVRGDLIRIVGLLLERRIRSLNRVAKIFCTHHGHLPLESVLGIKAFDLKQALTIAPALLEEDAHVHDTSIRSVAIREAGTVRGDHLQRWLYQLVQRQGRDLFRMKGILNLEDEERRFVFQGVHIR